MSTTDDAGLPVTADAAGNPTATPQPKVIAQATGGAAAGAVTTIGLWALTTYAHVDMPALVQGAVLVLVTVGIGFVSGYIKRPSAAAS